MMMDIIDSSSSHHHQQHSPHYRSSSTSSANECDVITSLNTNHEKSKYPTTSPTRRPTELLPPKTFPSEVPPSSKLPLITERTYDYGDNGNNHNNASSRSSLSFFSDTYHVTTKKKKTARKPPILQRWLSTSSSTTRMSPTSTPPDDMPVTPFSLDMTTTGRIRNTGSGCIGTGIVGKNNGLSNSLSSLLVVSSMLSTSKLISSSSSQSDISKMPSTSSSTSPVSSSLEISSQRDNHNSRGVNDRDKQRRPEGGETRMHRKISNSLPDISSSNNPSIHSNNKRNNSTRTTCDHTINDEDDDESTLESSLYHHHHHHHRRHHSHQVAEQVDEDLSDGEESTSLFTSVSCDDGIFSAADISSPSSSSSNSSESSSSSSTSSTVNEVVLDSKATIITVTDMTGRSSKVRKSSIGKTTNDEEDDFDFGIQEDEDFPDTYLDGHDVENEVPSDGEDITAPNNYWSELFHHFIRRRGSRKSSSSSRSLSTSDSSTTSDLPTVIINGRFIDVSSTRYSLLSYDQVVRLDNVLDSLMQIHGRGNFPTLEVKLKDLVSVVKNKLTGDHGIFVRDIRLNGGAASHVLLSSNDGGRKSGGHSYTDLDLIFAVDLNNHRTFDKVRTAVLDSLLEFLPDGVNRKKMSPCTLKEAYVHKMVKVTEGGDRWSLISLCNNSGRDIEIKFVDTMKRQFEFSVDSFQIILDSLLEYYECVGQSSKVNGSEDINVHDDKETNPKPPIQTEKSTSPDNNANDVDSPDESSQTTEEDSITTTVATNSRTPSILSENMYPTVVGESVYGDFREAMRHLERKLISTRSPEEIRGGGLLKYCRLQVLGYRPVSLQEIKTLEKYMCSRFFIDFSDINVQRVKLANYLNTHFGDQDGLKYQYLMILQRVVDESTVCLMGHERRQTLSLIEEFAYHYYYQQQEKERQLTNCGQLTPCPSPCPSVVVEQCSPVQVVEKDTSNNEIEKNEQQSSNLSEQHSKNSNSTMTSKNDSLSTHPSMSSLIDVQPFVPSNYLNSNSTSSLNSMATTTTTNSSSSLSFYQNNKNNSNNNKNGNKNDNNITNSASTNKKKTKSQKQRARQQQKLLQNQNQNLNPSNPFPSFPTIANGHQSETQLMGTCGHHHHQVISPPSCPHHFHHHHLHHLHAHTPFLSGHPHYHQHTPQPPPYMGPQSLTIVGGPSGPTYYYTPTYVTSSGQVVAASTTTSNGNTTTTNPIYHPHSQQQQTCYHACCGQGGGGSGGNGQPWMPCA